MGGAASVNDGSSKTTGADKHGTNFSVKLTEKGYPIAYPPSKSKADIFNPQMLIDATENISSQMTDAILDDYDALIECLSADCTTGLQKLCNIFAFIGLCDSKNRNLDSPIDKKQDTTSERGKTQDSLSETGKTQDTSSEMGNNQDTLSEVDKNEVIEEIEEIQRQPTEVGSVRQENEAERDTDSPRAYMKSIHGGVGRYAFFFAILCRKANLPCVLIPGVAKSATYDVGDTTLDKLRNVWAAVYIDADWRLVHPLWALKTLSGYKSDSWYLVDTSGNITMNGGNDNDSKKEETLHRLNSFWFLTDPEHFINWCFPDEQRWQLLEKPFSKDDFIKQLYRREAFFNMGLQVYSHDQCHLTTSSGYTEIVLKVPKSIDAFVIIHDLYRKAVPNPHAQHSDLVRHCIAMVKEFPYVKFKMRFPVADSFVLNLFGSDVGSSKTLEWLCSFRIDCTHAMRSFIPFPESPYNGWGVGHETEMAGLKPMTHTCGLVTTDKTDPLSFGFRYLKNVSVIADLLDQSNKYEPLVVKVGKTNVKVVVTLPPVNREYGLALYTKNADDGTVMNAVNYIIRRAVDVPGENQQQQEQEESDGSGNGEMGWKKMQRKLVVKDESSRCRKLKMKLARCAVEEDMYELEQTIQTYETCGYGNCVELTLAQKQHAFLGRKQTLKKAMKLKQTDELEAAIAAVKEHDDRKKLGSSLLQTAENLLVRLQRLEKSRQRVTEMNNRSVSEVKRYNNAVKTVHDVVAAVYALLGEDVVKIKEWRYVQRLLGRDGVWSIVQMVETCTVTELTENRVAACKAFMGEHTMNECRAVSSEIAAFYQWVFSMLDNYESTLNENGGDAASQDSNNLKIPKSNDGSGSLAPMEGVSPMASPRPSPRASPRPSPRPSAKPSANSSPRAELDIAAVQLDKETFSLGVSKSNNSNIDVRESAEFFDGNSEK